MILTPLGRVLDILHCNIKRYKSKGVGAIPRDHLAYLCAELIKFPTMMGSDTSRMGFCGGFY